MNLLVLTFIITALWDVILRWYSEDRMPHLPKPLNVHEWDFVIALKPYFKKHTLLGAAAIAGVVGAVTQAIILQLLKIPKTLNQIGIFLIVSFLISGLIGFPMQWSGLFPVLQKTYYKDLKFPRSFYSDAISGVIVQVTLLIILTFVKHSVNKV